MSILLVDFEATDKDAKKARPIEIGAMMVSDTFDPYVEYSQLIWGKDFPELTEEVQRVTHITPAMLKEYAIPVAKGFEAMTELVVTDHVKYVVAYNTAYDQTLFKAEMDRQGLLQHPKVSWLLQIPWLCALNDIEKNYEFKSRRLMHVALEYGVTVNPKVLHRAIADVELMRQFLVASGVTADEMYAFQQEPWIYVRAVCEKPWIDGGESTNFAKTKGYSWERAKGDPSDRVFPKTWLKRIKQSKFEQELTLPIKVERIIT